ncbi:hypothetical protein APHAL10511_003101 [Amanita phalloides]|nr:hypothetical protein APHAL10511_003101 [Amanita phalloides]
MNDTELVDSGDMAVASACPRINPKHALPPAYTPTSTCNRGIGLTPLTATTVDSVYSQDSWIEQEDTYAEVVHFRVDTRRFAVALSPGIDFIFPSTSASSPSAATGTFVAASEGATEAEVSLPPPPAADLRPDPEMLPRSMMATEVPVIPDASKPNGETPAEIQAPLTERRPIKRSPSMAKKLGRFLSRVGVVSFSGSRHHAAVKHLEPQHSPRDLLEPDFVIDLRNDGGSIASTEASDVILSPKQSDILLQQEASVYLPSSIDFHDNLLPTIAISPLAVTFDKAMNWDSQVDLYAPTDCDPDMELIGIAI